MDTKKHYKLYKDGKKWCVMAFATVASIVGLATSANADDVNTTTTSTVQTTQVAEETPATSTSDAASSAVQSNSVDAAEQTTNVDTNVASPAVTPVQPQDTQQKNGWVNENNDWTYYQNGEVTSGRDYTYLPTINGEGNSWYLVDNGVVQLGVQQWAGSYYDFDANNNYQRVDNNYVQSQWGMWYLFGNDGRIQTGVQQWAGSYYYFDPSTYLRVDNDYRQSQWGDWYLFGNDGRIQTGVQQWAGSYYYFDPSTYLRVDNDYRQSQWGDWYLFGNDGRILSGLQSWKGQTYYFDPTTFKKVVNQDVTVNNVKYHLDANGIAKQVSNVDAKVNRALSQRGVPYVWGGNTPAGFDCSGLVQWAYGLGSAYRTTYQQATLGAHKRDVMNAPKGSLLFFGSDGAPYHVAISLGNGTYVHAPEPGDVVKIGYSKYFTPSFYINM
ncbi:hydrolase Nlp/P60 [Limosilactobacillus reuteri]|uniref:Hydrolase Nlp/P60 n=1 Tax=Limosilactobacillus reuteri TaxID=1598 RepID=A0A855XK88_LIMRT|nr:NlpC/P60 family protein [Limosilactobacillus reuteri]PWT31188.1 hydrolase Nlp/P60 [Limosilactobacillus reuteri]PWT39358.1 hydrolase Nlp/P60 [Limosilactobacillus reuteri]PWT42865.1 hydrolase Nlp/P60 [Limosilactobacillus reuteri]PWT56560.1 hydrolase Nlp/P60 [Limosilactobacillus reuteri]PWT68169.1 hydrolase Nlp/P60 [Limosilactobacillus reuteri]